MNQVRMDLLHHDQGEVFRAHRRLQALTVFEDIFPGVPFHETQVEQLFAFERAHSAVACAEAMHEPRQFCEWDELENLQSAGFAQLPGRGDFAA